MVLAIVRFLYEDERFRFRYLTFATGIHLPNTEKPFGMVYQLHSLKTTSASDSKPSRRITTFISIR